MAINSIVNWQGWLGKPLWVLAAMQIVLVCGFSLLGHRVALLAARQEIMVINQNINQQHAAMRRLRRQMEIMPPIAVLQTRLAERSAERPPFGADTAARRVSDVLSQSGASLLSWQSEHEQDNDNDGLLAFSADYQTLLRLLRKFIVLPHVLRIERLAMKSVEGVLHIDMRLVTPAAARRTDAE